MDATLANSGNTWQDLYQAAIFERDGNKAAERIAQAESAITHRVQALTRQRGSAGASELEALNAALYALQLLKGCSPPSSAA